MTEEMTNEQYEARIKELENQLKEAEEAKGFEDIKKKYEDLIAEKDKTIKELENIPGVGAGKAKRYGEKFCKLIKQHCEDNEIERPEDLRIRTIANKSKLKVSIIQNIDRKVMLDDLAEIKGIDFDELLTEVEAIVYSGTKLNIDYFIEEILDDEHIDEIYDYFKQSETDNLEDAIKELGADYSEEEIRLVRIKFISELAN